MAKKRVKLPTGCRYEQTGAKEMRLHDARPGWYVAVRCRRCADERIVHLSDYCDHLLSAKEQGAGCGAREPNEGA